MPEDPQHWIGSELVDEAGDLIGAITDVYVDDATGEPEWAIVATDEGRRHAFVPLTATRAEGERLLARTSGDLVRAAPSAPDTGELSQQDEARLYAHYGLSYSHEESETGLAGEPIEPRRDDGHPSELEDTEERRRLRRYVAPLAVEPPREEPIAHGAPGPVDDAPGPPDVPVSPPPPPPAFPPPTSSAPTPSQAWGASLALAAVLVGVGIAASRAVRRR